MIKYLLLLLLPILLSANLTYTSNYNKELSLLESFNIDPSFLYDPIMNEMKATKIVSSSFNALEKSTYSTASIGGKNR